jgi:ATP-dependent RNA helicase DDX52/ROK1
MERAVLITVGARLATAANIDQKLVYCGNEEGKLVAIRTLLQSSCRPPVLVFVQSKERAQEL